MALPNNNNAYVNKSAKTVNPEDFWTTPYGNKSDAVNTKVKIKEEVSVTPDVFNGPRGINPNVLERSMRELEIELAKRENRPPEELIIDGISAKDMSRAEEKFEETIFEIKEKQSKIVYGKIDEASVEGIEEKVKELEEKYDYLTCPNDDTDYGFETISGDEFAELMANYEMEIAQKRHEIIRKMPGLTEEQKEKIKEFFENDVVAEPMDFVNSIPELSEKDLNRIRKKLDEIYALENESKPELKIKTI